MGNACNLWTWFLSGVLATKYIRSLLNLNSGIYNAGLKQNKKDTNGNPVKFQKIRKLRIEEFGQYQIKYTWNETESWKKVLIGTRQTPVTMSELYFALAKPGVRKISKEKYNDLQKLMPYVPARFQNFLIRFILRLLQK